MRKAKIAAIIVGGVSTCLCGGILGVYSTSSVVSSAAPNNDVENIFNVESEKLANVAAVTSIETTAVTTTSTEPAVVPVGSSSAPEEIDAVKLIAVPVCSTNTANISTFEVEIETDTQEITPAYSESFGSLTICGPFIAQEEPEESEEAEEAPAEETTQEDYSEDYTDEYTEYDEYSEYDEYDSEYNEYADSEEEFFFEPSTEYFPPAVEYLAPLQVTTEAPEAVETTEVSDTEFIETTTTTVETTTEATTTETTTEASTAETTTETTTESSETTTETTETTTTETTTVETTTFTTESSETTTETTTVATSAETTTETEVSTSLTAYVITASYTVPETDADEPVSVETETTVNSLPITDEEYIILCNAVANEAGSNWIDQYEKGKVVEVIMNRVNSPLYPDTILGVLTQYNQFTGAENYVYLGTFSGYVTDDVKAAVELYFNEPYSFTHNYFGFYGDGYQNHFY